MAATIRDVAKAAGVSPMAVSKVLHGRGASVRVSEATADRIRAAANTLSYSPNRMARSLRGGKTKTIGLVFETIGPFAEGSRYYPLLLDGIAGPCFSAGYALTLCPIIMRSPVAEYADGRFDGILWGRYQSDDSIFEEVAGLEIPVAMLHIPDRVLGDRPIIGACSDSTAGFEAAVAHLATLGHREATFLHEESHQENPETVDRCHAFHRATERSGLRGRVETFTERGGSRSHTEWLAAHPETTAVILRSDTYAPSFYAAAEALGRRIPEDLSVIGFDSTEYCDSLRPPLTSISQPVRSIAEHAALALIETIEGKTPPGSRFIFPCGFDVRASTAKSSPTPQKKSV